MFFTFANIIFYTYTYNQNNDLSPISVEFESNSQGILNTTNNNSFEYLNKGEIFIENNDLSANNNAISHHNNNFINSNNISTNSNYITTKMSYFNNNNDTLLNANNFSYNNDIYSSLGDFTYDDRNSAGNDNYISNNAALFSNIEFTNNILAYANPETFKSNPDTSFPPPENITNQTPSISNTYEYCEELTPDANDVLNYLTDKIKFYPMGGDNEPLIDELTEENCNQNYIEDSQYFNQNFVALQDSMYGVREGQNKNQSVQEQTEHTNTINYNMPFVYNQNTYAFHPNNISYGCQINQPQLSSNSNQYQPIISDSCNSGLHENIQVIPVSSSVSSLIENKISKETLTLHYKDLENNVKTSSSQLKNQVASTIVEGSNDLQSKKDSNRLKAKIIDIPNEMKLLNIKQLKKAYKFFENSILYEYDFTIQEH